MSGSGTEQSGAMTGKVAIVTGAQKGIGQAMAVAFSAAGAAIVLNWLDDEGAAHEVADQVRAAGVEAALVQGDVADAATGANLVEAAAALGGPDILINNAGIYPRADFLDLQEELWDQVLDVNLKGAFLCAQAAARWMVANDRPGAILNLASAAFWNPMGNGVHYTASKGGIIGLTRSMAVALAAHKIRVNVIAPGITDTEQPRGGLSEEEVQARGAGMPLGRLTRPGEIAAAALYLCSDGAAQVTGETLHVNAGQLLV
jgi:NAD(P)-dependent dehydrogenase (short-subunit alcohol dehydrogenase family)